MTDDIVRVPWWLDCAIEAGGPCHRFRKGKIIINKVSGLFRFNRDKEKKRTKTNHTNQKTRLMARHQHLMILIIIVGSPFFGRCT